MWTMSKQVARAAALGAILWATAGSGPLEAQGQPTPPQNALAGSRVFGSKGCVRCHAVDGIGGTEGPDLARNPQERTFYDLAASMWNHGPAMVQRMREVGIELPALDPEEAGDLIAFLYTLDYFDPPGDSAVGARLFVEKGCVSCHQVRGRGGVVGPDLGVQHRHVAPIEFAAAMWNHGPAMSQMMEARNIPRPMFTGTELIDLIAYIEAGHSGPPSEPFHVLPGLVADGRQVFVERGCVSCHTAAAGGGGLAPDLVEFGAHRSLVSFAAAMWNKAPAMLRAMDRRGIGVPQLRPDEVADLVGYLYSMDYFVAAGDAGRGHDVIVQVGCLDCHALRGRGASAAPDLAEVRHVDSPAAVVSTLWNHMLLIDQAEYDEWTMLDPRGMADLGAYLRLLAANRTVNSF
jgi:mono/diheme cytochrome c family protein